MASLPAHPINLRKIQCIVFSFFWIGSSCIAEFNGSSDLGELLERSANRDREFDFFMLSLLWPGTACLSSDRCCPSNACCRRSSALTEFTIHGLWPDYNDGTWQACCPGAKFDIKEISTLLSTMNKYWPSFSCESVSNCHGGTGLFWEHEWEKHGPCSFPVVRDEYDYFETALNLYFKYNVTEVLREAGYVASNSEKYPLAGIVSAIENAFYATPEIVCSGDAVEELRLCFYKDFKVVLSLGFGIVALKSKPKVANLIQKIHVPVTSAYRNLSRWMLKAKKYEASESTLKPKFSCCSVS